MGLFGSTKIYVSSTVYNLAGDVDKRPNYLKNLVASNIIGGTRGRSMSNAMVDGYLKGPGIRIRNFGLWADRDGNYPAVGVIQGNLYSQLRIPPELAETAIIPFPGGTIKFQRIEVGPANFAYWAEQWMLVHHPELIETEWTSDFDDVTGEIVIKLEDLTEIRFEPEDFERQATYMYGLYTVENGREENPVVEGSVVTLDPDEPYPDVTGWTPVSSETHVENFTLEETTTVTSTYSDGRPDEVSTSTTTSPASYEYYRAIFSIEEQLPSEVTGPDQVLGLKHIMNFFRDGTVQTSVSENETSEEVEPGVTKTTTTVVETEYLDVVESYRLDTQEIVYKTWSPARLVIYRVGSGDAPLIDERVTSGNQKGYYLPFIPVRLDNKMVDEAHFPDLLPQVTKAYKKLTTGKFGEDLADPLSEHEKIDDIDYAYVMPGVALNTKENASRKYLFDYFKRLLQTQEIGDPDYDSWSSDQSNYVAYSQEWLEWREAQFDELNPLFGTPEPVQQNTSAIPTNEVQIRGSGTVSTNYDVRISWTSMSSATGTGLAKPGARVGDTWVDYGSTDTYSDVGYNEGEALPIDALGVDRLNITRQISENSWETLRIFGLKHRNYIYKGKYVEITAKEALADAEESGFLVPIHFETYTEMSLVDSTQMSMAAVYMVINTYVVKKTGFFGSTFFKIFLVVVAIAITVATGGTGAFSSGILGSSAAVGAALGVTGLLGLIVGAMANAVAAILLTKIISLGATAIFGEKLGAIIGAIASVVALSVGSGLAAGQSMSTIFSNLGSAMNIISMTAAVGDGVAGYVRASANELIQKTERLQEDYEKRSQEISRLYAQNIGTDRAMLDPLSIISDGGWAAFEKADSFLGRTLLTGGEIAEFTMGMLDNFADITLSTDLNF